MRRLRTQPCAERWNFNHGVTPMIRSPSSETAPRPGRVGISRRPTLDEDNARRCTRGFTIVEIIVAIVVLSVGLLGLAGTTLLVVRQVTLAGMTTERTAALQTTVERLRALPFADIASGSDSVGVFRVQWTVTVPSTQWKVIRVITTGPGAATGAGGFPTLSTGVSDTLTYRVLKP